MRISSTVAIYVCTVICPLGDGRIHVRRKERQLCVDSIWFFVLLSSPSVFPLLHKTWSTTTRNGPSVPCVRKGTGGRAGQCPRVSYGRHPTSGLGLAGERRFAPFLITRPWPFLWKEGRRRRPLFSGALLFLGEKEKRPPEGQIEQKTITVPERKGEGFPGEKYRH